MSAVDLKTAVKPHFDLKDFKCRPAEASVLASTKVKSHAGNVRPMGDLENSRDCQNFDMENEPAKHGKGDGVKFSYPIHRKRSRFVNRSGAADNYHNKKRRKGEKIILPTKFLLGGNINDPLNLNSLCDEEVNRALNERTPQSSPVPTPAHRRDVAVVMPRNQFDPLNLNEPDMENEPLTPAKMNAKRKKRHKGRKKSESNTTGDSVTTPTTPICLSKESEKKKILAEALKIEIDDESVPVPTSTVVTPRHNRSAVAPLTLSVSTPVLSSLSSGTGSTSNTETSENHKVKSEDKIVSPVIPQLSPKNRKRRLASFSESRTVDSNLPASKSFSRAESCPNDIGKPTITRKNRKRQSHRGGKGGNSANSKSARFIYGNYNRYYGYRNTDDIDHRTNCFKHEWFEGKKVLDIGCNVGHLTLFVAREFKPQMIVGLDIDSKLISAARNNIRHYMSKNDQNKFPASCKLSYGPLAAPYHEESQPRVFPQNVSFRQGNYVPENDDFLDLQKADYDLILAMSLTKWIHLNWGDAGLKRSFRRMYRQLKPGGKLILEPQAWGSYKKRKWISENIRKNFQNIHLKPDNFAEYLIEQIGFSRYEVIDVPFNQAKGFQRPIFLFHKDPLPSSSLLSYHGEINAQETSSAGVSSSATAGQECEMYDATKSSMTITEQSTAPSSGSSNECGNKILNLRGAASAGQESEMYDITKGSVTSTEQSSASFSGPSNECENTTPSATDISSSLLLTTHSTRVQNNETDKVSQGLLKSPLPSAEPKSTTPFSSSATTYLSSSSSSASAATAPAAASSPSSTLSSSSLPPPPPPPPPSPSSSSSLQTTLSSTSVSSVLISSSTITFHVGYKFNY
ncbi:7SK snRNA methylphosphate capping enzyme [Octopus bimaculoides]|uniref:7SK snRNA methylphosphate capping enzyme n=1 Tax=Octopus bimaculoides TaxID=37653 RepID=UPI00071CE1A3|nr:7SK snRNA methylphosphate capping enzyme [Octopus bimaculoides]|eukprot:XP_014783515.1 PREDICTED: 7SK snRNA methylphosphate capping enzyme-like [Octopus bimaculoides]